MECSICFDQSKYNCVSCDKAFCDRCTIKCNECRETYCLECSPSCDSCGANLCEKCTCDVDVCSCCNRELDTGSMKTCISCVAGMWLKTKCGPKCDKCKLMCNGDKCSIKVIISSQKECPICWEKFNANGIFQHCGIHMVCRECDYNPDSGCPICREGKVH